MQVSLSLPLHGLSLSIHNMSVSTHVSSDSAAQKAGAKDLNLKL